MVLLSLCLRGTLMIWVRLVLLRMVLFVLSSRVLLVRLRRFVRLITVLCLMRRRTDRFVRSCRGRWRGLLWACWMMILVLLFRLRVMGLCTRNVCLVRCVLRRMIWLWCVCRGGRIVRRLGVRCRCLCPRLGRGWLCRL